MPAINSPMPTSFLAVIGSAKKTIAPMTETTSIAVSTMGIEIEASSWRLLATKLNAAVPIPMIIPAMMSLVSSMDEGRVIAPCQIVRAEMGSSAEDAA